MQIWLVVPHTPDPVQICDSRHKEASYLPFPSMNFFLCPHLGLQICGQPAAWGGHLCSASDTWPASQMPCAPSCFSCEYSERGACIPPIRIPQGYCLHVNPEKFPSWNNSLCLLRNLVSSSLVRDEKGETQFFCSWIDFIKVCFYLLGHISSSLPLCVCSETNRF